MSKPSVFAGRARPTKLAADGSRPGSWAGLIGAVGLGAPEADIVAFVDDICLAT